MTKSRKDIDDVVFSLKESLASRIAFEMRDKAGLFPSLVRISVRTKLEDGSFHFTEFEMRFDVDDFLLEEQYQKICKELAIKEANDILGDKDNASKA